MASNGAYYFQNIPFNSHRRFVITILYCLYCQIRLLLIFRLSETNLIWTSCKLPPASFVPRLGIVHNHLTGNGNKRSLPDGLGGRKFSAFDPHLFDHFKLHHALGGE